MTIKERKEKLESTILDLIIDFQKETELYVDTIIIESMNVTVGFDDKKMMKVNITAKI